MIKEKFSHKMSLVFNFCGEKNKCFASVNESKSKVQLKYRMQIKLIVKNTFINNRNAFSYSCIPWAAAPGFWMPSPLFFEPETISSIRRSKIAVSTAVL